MILVQKDKSSAAQEAAALFGAKDFSPPLVVSNEPGLDLETPRRLVEVRKDRVPDSLGSLELVHKLFLLPDALELHLVAAID